LLSRYPDHLHRSLAIGSDILLHKGHALSRKKLLRLSAIGSSGRGVDDYFHDRPRQDDSVLVLAESG
jgi:hypothetical protein